MGWARSRRLLGRLPVTAEIGLLAILIGLVIALPVGIYSAVRQYTAADYVNLLTDLLYASLDPRIRYE